MTDKRFDRLDGLAWPPTCAFFVHNLHLALKELIGQSERFGACLDLPGFDLAGGERELWHIIHGIQRLLDLSSAIRHEDRPIFSKRWEAETWLCRILSTVRVSDPRVPPPGSAELARRLCGDKFVQAYRSILDLIPDPFGGSTGTQLSLFEWARYHLGTPFDQFEVHAPLPRGFMTRWNQVATRPTEADLFGPGSKPPDLVKARRRLLVEAGLLHRDPAVDPPVLSDAEVAYQFFRQLESKNPVDKNTRVKLVALGELKPARGAPSPGNNVESSTTRPNLVGTNQSNPNPGVAERPPGVSAASESVEPASENPRLDIRFHGPDPSASESQANPQRKPDRLSAGAMAVAAACDLAKMGRRVSLKAACELARVDRKNVRLRYPDAVKAIRELAAPDRSPRRGVRDRRTGNLDAEDLACG